MKKITLYRLLTVVLTMSFAACTEKFDEINHDPNNPAAVKTSSLMTNAQKNLMDDLHDEWFGGRLSYVFSQQFAQKNYPQEDRYQLRQSVNNDYWTRIYGSVMDLVEIIRLNTEGGAAGKPNEIAAARILKVWAMQILTDIYGDVPYFHAFDPDGDVTPAYTPQREIYADFLKELTEASEQIDVSAPVFTEGDIIYDGDPVKWKKFANSLKMRVAIRLSNVDPSYLSHIQQAIAEGVFESNDDNATYRYLMSTPNAAPMYQDIFVDNRNDFSLSKPLVDLLTGVNDNVNGKTNPFSGMLDPRLTVWVVPNAAGKYVGMPYGLPDNQTAQARDGVVNLKEGGTLTAPNLALPIMTYAEVCFIRSEIEGWDQTWYERGVAASLEQWREEATATRNIHEDYGDMVDAYLAALPSATEETVLTQKYIALFTQGFEAWSEFRRTGYPLTLLRPGEVSYISSGGTPIVFDPLVGDDIPSRVNYPVIEQTLNPDSYQEAVTTLGGPDVMSTKVWWDK